MSAPAPKPFSLQAPERIAMEYGGNKQKIAQAVQSGLVDPTAGLLAGMFIDRMRSAQAQEQAPNQTVAQQVLGPQGPQGGPPPPGGPPPQGAPQGGPPGGPPPPPPPQGGPPPQGPVGMAEGGLTSLPVPDYMFDEQTFAGGGIVAFDAGGDARTARLKALMATMGNPNFLRESTSAERRAIAAEINQLSGTIRRASEGPTLGGKSLADIDVESRAKNEAAGQVPFRGFGDALGGFGDALKSPEFAAIDAESRAKNEAAGQVPFRGFGDALRSPEFAAIDAESRAKNEAAGQVPFRGFGDAFTTSAQASPVAPSASGYKPNLGSVNMGGEARLNALLGKPAPTAAPAAPAARATPAAVVPAPRTNITDIIRSAAKTKNVPTPTARPDLPTDVAGAAGVAPALTGEALIEQRKKDYAEAYKMPEYKGTSAEDKAARKKEDFWSAMAQAGFGMMAGTSQNALTNIGEGLKAAMPTMQAALKERRADEREERKEEFAYRLAQSGVKGKAYEFGVKQFDELKKSEQEKVLAQLQVDTQLEIAKGNNATSIAAARISASKQSGGEQAVAAYYNQALADATAAGTPITPQLKAKLLADANVKNTTLNTGMRTAQAGDATRATVMRAIQAQVLKSATAGGYLKAKKLDPKLTKQDWEAREVERLKGQYGTLFTEDLGGTELPAGFVEQN